MVELLAPEMTTQSPQCTDALDRAQHHLTLGEYAEAVESCSKAIECCPSEPMAYLYRALAYELIGDAQLAAADYDRAAHLSES